MAEGGRLVLFQQEMTGPCKAVAERNPQQSVPGMMCGKGNDRDDQTQGGSNGVHPAVSRFAVLLQVEAEELFIGAECPRSRHGKYPLAKCYMGFRPSHRDENNHRRTEITEKLLPNKLRVLRVSVVTEFRLGEVSSAHPRQFTPECRNLAIALLFPMEAFCRT